jgi:uncharacterized nucleotidyltransferase DUF6036
MNFPQTLQRVTTALDRAGVAYMLTGSFASAYYGAPRSTQDIDLVIEATPAQLRAFIQSLPQTGYYADLDASLEALRRESMFNIIDLTTGWKIDMMIRKARPFSQEEFGRRQSVSVQGSALSIASAEDVVIAKLEWSRLAQSQRQIEDVSAILRMRWESLDQLYLRKWIRELRLEKEWNDARRAAEISG